MRRGNKRKFGREKVQRGFLYRSLATALIKHGKIKTTQARAKSLSGYAERLITLAKKQNLASRRLLLKHLGSEAVKKLMSGANRFGTRRGGYTRIIRLGQRRSDGSPMAYIEWTN